MNKYIKWLIFIFIILIIAVLIFYVSFSHRPSYIYRPVRRFFSNHVHRSINANDVNTVQSWMTFDYINKVFKIPSDYLKNTLVISDSSYPNETIGHYARSKKEKSSVVLTQVQEALHNYLTGGK